MVTIDISQAASLQAAIQKQLSDYGYSTEDDPVMAEYVTVMLANNKSSSQITAELSDLIGPEYDSAFTDWIFENAIPEHYAGPGGGGAGGQSASQTIDTPKTAVPSSGTQQEQTSQNQQQQQQQQQQQVEAIQTVGDSREMYNRQRHNLPTRPPGGLPTGPRGPAGGAIGGQGQQNGGPAGGQRGVFGTAMAGLKREGDPSLDRPNRRPRMSDGYEQNGAQPQDQERSIFDRAGVRAGTAQPNNFMNMGGQQQQQPPRGFGRGGPPGPPGFQQGGPPRPPFASVPQVPGLPALHIPDNFNSLPPAQQQAIQQQIFQHQLIAAAAAQQMYQQHTGAPSMPQQQQQQGMMPFPGMQNGQQFPPQPMQQQHGQHGQQARKPSKPVKLPSRPTSEELCKYGVECKNAICRYSHPSPSATKESGLVLSKEVCDKGLECDDKDCPKSHVSPAQKTDPQGLNVAQYKQKAASASAPPVQQIVAVHIPAANPGAKPCMFGAACTRPGCFFSHPTTNPTATACRFGIHCTRRDCHFSHPAGRKIDNTSSSSSSSFSNNNNISGSPGQQRNGHASGSNFPSFTPKNMSATFSSNGAVTSTTGAGQQSPTAAIATPAEDSKMSARLKKFMENGSGGNGQGDAERIIAGKQESNDTSEKVEEDKPKEEDKDDDLEVVI